MGRELPTLLGLEAPIVVRLGERKMPLREVLNLVPGSIIELNKNAEDELELLVNNVCIGNGTAVKVGENFGIRISYVGDPSERVEAAGGGAYGARETSDEELAEAMLSGQL